MANVLDAKIGDKVKHAKFGYGKVVKVEPKSEAITIDFDNEMDGKKQRIIKASFLTYVSPAQEEVANNKNKEVINNNQTFKIGDYVFHKEFGDGIIVAKKGFFKYDVKFKKDDKILTVLNTSITIKNIDIIDDDELIEESFDSKFKVIPSNYSEQSCYSTTAKRFLTYLRKKYPDDGIATIKSYSESNGQIGVLIVPDKGIIIFNLIDTDYPLESLNSPMFEKLFENRYNQLHDFFLNGFLQSKTLCRFIDANNKILKFPMRFVFLFQNIDISKLDRNLRSKTAVKNNNFYFKGFSSLLDNNDIFSCFEKYDKDNFQYINQKYYGSIIERVVPENATLVSISPKTSTKKNAISNNPKFYPITGNEREFSALYLDDNQIKSINDTKPGHYLTLANPGTGKSVLLVSKAYRIQSIKSDNHALITCYNNNLAEHHNIFADISGMKTSNLHIKTFHKFVLDILSQVDPYFVKTHSLDSDYDDNFNNMVDRFITLLDEKKINTKLNAIFIDEVQLFDPKWIDICYRLLDKENKDYFFEMYGDINQDVKSLHSKGKASWQNTKYIPSLQGRVRKLDKNYRNTDLIANYLTCMISEFNEFLGKHGIDIDKESSCLSSMTLKKGSLRTKILISANNDVTKVRKTIEELVDKKNAEYNEIAVIYPAKGYGKYYNPVYYLESELTKHNIPYSKIHGDLKTKLYDCDGVIFSTIDSCLGLDFKYVVLCGIHFWDFVYLDNGTEKLDMKKILFNQQAKLYYCEIGKKIYSACSRAREGLYIIDDLDEKSPIKNILRPASGRRYYDEY